MNEIQININRIITEALPDAIRAGMEDALQTVENKACEKCPVNDGILRASIVHQQYQDSNHFKGDVGSNVEYAPYVHEGTGIYAREGHGRQTPWSYCDAAGVWHTTKGQKSQPFLQQALDDCLDIIPRCFEGRLR